MKKEINIVLETESIPKDGSSRLVSLDVKGTLYKKGDLVCILYKENPEEFGDTLTTLKINPQRLDIVRTGDISSRLTFNKSRTFEGVYTTPYGNLPVKTEVSDMESYIGENEGSVSMHYTLDFSGEITENKFKLNYLVI